MTRDQRAALTAAGISHPTWEAFNERRAALIDKEVAGTLDPTEAAELKQLQAAADRYLDAVSPIRLEGLDWLEQRVRELKAQKAAPEPRSG